MTGIIDDTIPNFKIDNLREKYNESLLKRTDLSIKEIDIVLKKVNLYLIEHSLSI